MSDIEQAGKEIAEDLNSHNWSDAAQSLSTYAQTLDREQFRSLTQEIVKHDAQQEGIDIGPIFAVGRQDTVDAATNTSQSEIVRSYVGTDASVYTPDGRIFGSTLRNPQDVPNTILELGAIYDASAAEMTPVD